MILYLAWKQFRYILKNPILTGIMIAGPFLLVFVLGQALHTAFSGWNNGPDAMSYFAVIFLSMAVMYGSMVASWGLSKERTQNTLIRLRTAPIIPFQISIGLFLGGWLAVFILMSALVLLLKLLLNVQFGTEDVIVILILLCGTFFASSLGFFVSLTIREEKNNTGILNSIIPLIIFLGGGYIPIPASGILYEASRFSPMRWIVLKMMENYYPDLNIALAAPVFINLVPGIVLLALSILIIRKRGLQ